MRISRLASASVAALACAALLAGCGGGGKQVVAVFDDAGDLQPQHSVQVADVRVGEITSIKLTDDYKARVTMTIKSDLQVPADSVAILRTTSLLGEKFVEIRPKGDPTKGPFLHDGSVLKVTQEAPELEFIAEEAVQVLGAVNASDVATLAKTGAEAFGGRGTDLRGLIDDLATVSKTFADRAGTIGQVIDNLDATAATLAAGSKDVDGLLSNLATTTQILADNRQRAIDALAQLSRLAAVQNDVLGKHRAAIERQIGQADRIVAEVAGHTQEVATLVDVLHGFATNIPRTIPGDFTQVYMWLVPASGPGTPGCQDPRACGS
jgi:phospholipid/cholesterol/gamma-HCH transport system substrate-binding protein